MKTSVIICPTCRVAIAAKRWLTYCCPVCNAPHLRLLRQDYLDPVAARRMTTADLLADCEGTPALLTLTEVRV